MFKCQACGKGTKPHEKATKIVLQTRKRTYYNPESEVRANTTGSEIVKELTIGPCCVNIGSTEFPSIVNKSDVIN